VNVTAWTLAAGFAALFLAFVMGPALIVKAHYHRGRRGRRPLI
jgi:hypothetical protein